MHAAGEKSLNGVSDPGSCPLDGIFFAQVLQSGGGGGTSQGRLNSECGVFVGVSTPDYADLKKLHTPIGVYSATGACGVGGGGGVLGVDAHTHRGIQRHRCV